MITEILSVLTCSRSGIVVFARHSMFIALLFLKRVNIRKLLK